MPKELGAAATARARLPTLSFLVTNTALDSTVRDNLDAYFVARLGA